MLCGDVIKEGKVNCRGSKYYFLVFCSKKTKEIESRGSKKFFYDVDALLESIVRGIVPLERSFLKTL
jgi:hypothetical protein